MGNESRSEGWCQTHDEGKPHCDIGRPVRIEKGRCVEDAQHPCQCCIAGGQEDGCIHGPRLARLKIRTKPATKAGKKEVFGKLVMVKAKPARKIVKAYPVAALKKSI